MSFMEDKTLEYYNKNAKSFVNGTLKVDFKATQDKFLKFLLHGDKILDFGCGSGRDTKYFTEKGFVVEATDGSAELCKIASKYTGISVKQMLFQELEAVSVYDGIWACSSILHLPKAELASVLHKMQQALKPEGVIYTSFKYSDFEGERNGRYFTDFTEKTFHEFMSGIPGIAIRKLWISEDIRPGRSDEKWLNLILQKSDTV